MYTPDNMTAINFVINILEQSNHIKNKKPNNSLYLKIMNKVRKINLEAEEEYKPYLLIDGKLY